MNATCKADKIWDDAEACDSPAENLAVEDQGTKTPIGPLCLNHTVRWLLGPKSQVAYSLKDVEEQ